MQNQTSNEFKKEFPYEEDYFDTLPQKVWKKIDAKEAKKVQKSFYQQHKHSLISSFSIGILLISAWGIYRVFDHNPSPVSEPLTHNTSEFKDSIAQNTNINTDQIKLISVSSINKSETEAELNLENISKTDLENYLVSQDIDLNLYFE